MGQQEPSGKRPKATRIDEDSIAFSRVVPVILITLVVITVVLIAAAVLVVLGVF